MTELLKNTDCECDQFHKDEEMEPIMFFQDENRYLSNFFPCIVQMEGDIYPTVEHAYQASKTSDKDIRESIRKSVTPGIAKRLGRTITPSQNWEVVKTGIMHNLLIQKFVRSAEFRERLMGTGNRLIVEGNTWHDNFWGECFCGKKCVGIESQNNLGKILMQIRKVEQQREK